ncbi:hypothetical protein WJX73_008200 [Symbiochloris irregularis]|uniref:Uncharacterized protein n=1 Tax=Symbiochloris irregularis TaxID=706552 RepID=A0AAW1NN27_9CHLO
MANHNPLPGVPLLSQAVHVYCTGNAQALGQVSTAANSAGSQPLTSAANTFSNATSANVPGSQGSASTGATGQTSATYTPNGQSGSSTSSSSSGSQTSGNANAYAIGNGETVLVNPPSPNTPTSPFGGGFTVASNSQTETTAASNTLPPNSPGAQNTAASNGSGSQSTQNGQTTSGNTGTSAAAQGNGMSNALAQIGIQPDGSSVLNSNSAASTGNHAGSP